MRSCLQGLSLGTKIEAQKILRWQEAGFKAQVEPDADVWDVMPALLNGPWANRKVMRKNMNKNEFIEGSLEVKLPTIWRDEKQSREEAERREEEKE